MKTQTWNIGSVFAIPLADRRKVVAQVLGHDPKLLNAAVLCGFTLTLENEHRFGRDLDQDAIISVQFTTRDLLDNGTWRIIDFSGLPPSPFDATFEELRSKGFVGARVIGSGIITSFLNACFALEAWDAWHDPTYLDQLLIDPRKKPKLLMLSSDDTPN